MEQIDPHEELDLSEIEDAALAVRQGAGADMTQALVETQTQVTAPDIACPNCGEILRYQGKKPKQVSCRSGDSIVERPYYHSHPCSGGH